MNSAKAFSGMDDRDSVYDRMDSPRLHGRGELLDALMADVERGCTLFGFDGVGGAGKSALAARFASYAVASRGAHLIEVDLGEWPDEALLIAGLHSRLRTVPRSDTQKVESAGRAFMDRAVGIVRNVAAAAVADAIKYASDKVENVAAAIKEEITGENAEKGVSGLLAAQASNNQRLFLSGYMRFVADLGNEVFIVLDNYDSAEPSAQETARFILRAKPAHWTVVLVDNNERPSGSDWATVMAPTIDYERGVVRTVPCLGAAETARFIEMELRRPPEPGEVDLLLRESNGGRPKLLADHMRSLAQGSALEPPPDLSRLHTVTRTRLTEDARILSELIAVAPADRVLPMELVEAAAVHAGVAGVGAAVDELVLAEQVRSRDRSIAFTHSSRWEAARQGMTRQSEERAIAAWFAVYRDRAGDSLPIARAGLLPAIAPTLVKSEPDHAITATARGLVAAGQQNEALSLLDASWQVEHRMESGMVNVIEHALVAAQTRLDLGRYRDAQEALRTVEVRGGQTAEQGVEADLIRLKLALRLNSYASVWTLSDRLLSEAAGNAHVQIERELVVNTALRDLHDPDRIRGSVETLRAAMANADPALRGRANRSLARSLAKLGDTDAALEAAAESLQAAEEQGDVRAIGNARLAMAEALRHAGLLEKAIGEYRKGEELARGSGNRDSEIWCILGQASAWLQAGDAAATRVATSRARRIVSEPGYQHPLETAHVGLLDALADALDGVAVDRASVLAPYADLGIQWPDALLDRAVAAATAGGPIEPIPI